jgi:NADH dehydrogenase [ubiquinone] 1 alpha subcomplex assembly factor 7
MTDILQLATASTLQDFGKTITTVNLVETSRVLREQQQAALNERLGDIIDFEFVHKSPFLTMKNEEGGKATQNSTVATTSTKKFQMRIEWHDTFTSFARNRDKDIPVFVVAQEFLDALPVHSFQKTEEGWRERLIDVASVEDEPPQEGEVRPRLRQVLAPDVTPAVKLFIEPNRQYDHVPDGTVIEVCPDAILLVQDISKVLEQSRGVALMIDYGQDGTADTLRAFSNHKQVPLTSRPGQVDVTADVDFFALRNAVQSSSEEVSVPRQIHAFGPVPQGEFLMRMGAADMVINSIEQDDTSPDHAQKLSDALKYLVLPQHMGEKFKVLALAPKRDGIFAPAGMET